MSQIRDALLAMPDETNSFLRINYVTVERTGTSGWCIDSCVTGLERATMYITLTSDHVILDLFKD